MHRTTQPPPTAAGHVPKCDPVLDTWLRHTCAGHFTRLSHSNHYIHPYYSAGTHGAPRAHLQLLQFRFPFPKSPSLHHSHTTPLADPFALEYHKYVCNKYSVKLPHQPDATPGTYSGFRARMPAPSPRDPAPGTPATHMRIPAPPNATLDQCNISKNIPN